MSKSKITNRIFLDLHVIQSVPPSCINRDDTGSPKTAVYGGVRRARVSSQSWKRAMRTMFKENFDERKLGLRTKHVSKLVTDEIMRQDSAKTPDEALKLMKEIFVNMHKILSPKSHSSAPKKSLLSEDKLETDALFFISRPQIEFLVEHALNKSAFTTNELVEIFEQNEAVDTALFGRMVAGEKPLLNCDASAQVAHAISTHRAENEFDFFTAVDDCSRDDNAGAGHLGTVEYNSATLYRYATVAVHDLYEQLMKDDNALTEAVREFVRAFACSMPTGKQNTFAANTLPAALLICVRKDRPLNFADAFEKPITGGDGFIEKSVQKLSEYAKNTDFCDKPVKTYAVGQHFGEIDGKISLNELLERIGEETVRLVKV